MNILIFGASGRTGQQLVLQALAMGHDVTVIVRRPKQFTLNFDRLRVVSGDALDKSSFAMALNGQEAVVSALGITGLRNSLRPMTFHADTARNILDQMQAHGVRRFVGITSVGVEHSSANPLWYRLTLQWLLRHKYDDMARMEGVIKQSGLQWTIVRPTRLTNGPLTQVYRADASGLVSQGTSSISRPDVADFCLQHLSRSEYFNHVYALSY